jgi:glycosyltransferase involved in cell wall biosynthesis
VRPSLSVLIVAWNSSSELRRTLPPLLAELRDGDELIVVDNDSPDDWPPSSPSSRPRRRS